MPSPLTSAGRDGVRPPPTAKVCRRLEGAVAVAQQHAHRVAAEVGDDQVGPAVAVEVRRPPPKWGRGRRCRLRGLEGAVAVAQQHAHGVAAGVGDDEVGLAVAGEVRRPPRKCVGRTDGEGLLG